MRGEPSRTGYASPRRGAPSRSAGTSHPRDASGRSPKGEPAGKSAASRASAGGTVRLPASQHLQLRGGTGMKAAPHPGLPHPAPPGLNPAGRDETLPSPETRPHQRDGIEMPPASYSNSEGHHAKPPAHQTSPKRDAPHAEVGLHPPPATRHSETPWWQRPTPTHGTAPRHSFPPAVTGLRGSHQSHQTSPRAPSSRSCRGLPLRRRKTRALGHCTAGTDPRSAPPVPPPASRMSALPPRQPREVRARPTALRLKIIPACSSGHGEGSGRSPG